MNKNLRVFIVSFVLFIAYAIVFAPSVFALGESMDLTVTTVIDNAAEYPAECAALSSNFMVVRIQKMKNSFQTGNEPLVTTRKLFEIVNNQKRKINFGSYYGATCDTFWFEPSKYTDEHLSLHSVEYTDADNLRSYTYSPTGDPGNPNSTEPMNWVEVIDSSKKAASVTLHFRYNPDIGSVPSGPGPEPDYSKKIDYLGDGDPNPDTTVDGKNDYRLYLDVTTQEAEEDNKADIIFALDVSGSMGYDLGGQSRISVLKSTMIDAINNLTQNPYNRISIIKFATNSEVLVSNSTDKDQLIRSVNSLHANGATNYYQSLLDVKSEINTMISSDTQNREKVIVFITDGEPTNSRPIGAGNTYAGLIYAHNATQQLSNVDRFFSIFIGNDSGSASKLQTLTQLVSVKKEKFMVQASSSDQVSDTLDRFMSKMSNALYNVTISDELSPYVAYTGGLKVMRTTGDEPLVTLKSGIDYSISTKASGPSIQLLEATIPDSKYTMSFNVRSSEEAFDYYGLNQSYPNIGDAGTDYENNVTSSGQPGFNSSISAALKYSYGGNGSAEKVYAKPVVQVVEPEAVSFEIRARKQLIGKDLEAGMFTFELIKVNDNGDVVVGTVANDAHGFITFDSLGLNKSGTYTYKIKEVIPSTPQPGMAYDRKIIQVTVEVTKSGDDLVAEVRYPSETVFVNTYTPQPVSVILKANKELTGRTLTAGMFDFSLLEGSGVSIETVSNTASGKIQFSPLTFTKAGVYTYTIKESLPIPANPNIEYDLKIVNAKITVTDKEGVLAANVQYTPDATFRNQYTYPPLSASIELKKVLTGMQLTTGLFEFELKDEATGSTITEKNRSDGTISFHLTFTNPGTHTYTIKEVIPTSPNKYMTYDNKTIQVTVKIEEDASGKLVTKITYPEDPVFYNSYKVRGGIW